MNNHHGVQAPNPQTHVLNGVIAIERPAAPLAVSALDKTTAQALGRELASELAAALAESTDTATPPPAELGIVAALYEPATLLQPGFPVHTRLLRYLQAATSGSENKQKLLTIGSNEHGQLPDGLQPAAAHHPGPLQVMPFVLTTTDAALADRFEQRLMDRGLISPRTQRQLATAWQTPVEHANFLSLLDLIAMMRTQFEHAGFLPEWEIIEAALLNAEPQCRQHSQQANDYFLYHDLLFTPFFSFDFWAQHGPGAKLDGQQRIRQWLHWLQRQRQAVAVMQAHGLDVRQYLPQQWPESAEKICLGGLNQQVVSEDFFTEIHGPIDAQQPVTVTEQHIPGLGTVVYTLSQDQGRQLQHLYPLTPEGLNAIPEHLQSLFGEHLRLNGVNALSTDSAAGRLTASWPH